MYRTIHTPYYAIIHAYRYIYIVSMHAMMYTSLAYVGAFAGIQCCIHEIIEMKKTYKHIHSYTITYAMCLLVCIDTYSLTCTYNVTWEHEM